MKKFTLLILLTCLPLISFAQDSYENLVVEGKTWTTVFDNLNPSALTQYKYYLKGDTVIDNTHCTKMFSAKGNDAAQYIGAMREDGRKVYLYERGKTEARLLYDFSLKVGDPVVADSKYPCKVESIEEVTVKGRKLKKLNLLETATNEYMPEPVETRWSWLEGVGSYVRPVDNGPFYVGCYEYLLSCQGKGETLYYNDDYNRGPQFVKEGKSWTTIVNNHECVYTFKGDTTINDTIYKKMYRDGVYVYSARQQGMKVYWRDFSHYYDGNSANGDNNKEELAINFGLKEGDKFDTGRNYILEVGKVDTVTANGINYRRLLILHHSGILDSGYNGNDYFIVATWVDGIGVNNEPLTPLGSILIPTYIPASCYDNGVKIFSWNDFSSPAGTDGIENAIKPNNNKNDENIYDLSGRKLNAVPQKGLYIKGKKVYAK